MTSYFPWYSRNNTNIRKVITWWFKVTNLKQKVTGKAKLFINELSCLALSRSLPGQPCSTYSCNTNTLLILPQGHNIVLGLNAHYFTTPSTHTEQVHFAQTYLSSSIMLSQEFLQRLPDLDDVRQYIRNISTPVLVSMGAVAAATTYYLATQPKALPPVCDLHMQSIEVPVSLRAKSVC